MAVRRPAALTDRDLWSAYPFLPGAEGLVTELAPSLRDVLTAPVFGPARELARARIRVAVEDPTGATGVAELAQAPAEMRYLSFLYARLLLSSLSVAGPLRRWAVAEAKQATGRLAAAPPEELFEVARRLGFGFDAAGDQVAIPLPDYLHLAVPIREADFRLVRQALRGGQVAVGRDRAARLLQEGLRMRLAVPVSVGPDVRDALAGTEAGLVEEVLARVPTPTSRPGGPGGPLRPEVFPPCIRHMRRVLEAGENLSHAGRFALAAFLHRAGASFETIVDAYRGAPDFDEGITRYQVEHITLRDEGRGYEPPECATLRSHGLCFWDGDPASPSPNDRVRDPLCHETFLRHPLQYYRIRGGSVAERPADAASGAGRSR